MNNLEIIAKVEEWQDNPKLHSLTCGNNSSHAPLVAFEMADKVRLKCIDCDYIQDYIPLIVLDYIIK